MIIQFSHGLFFCHFGWQVQNIVVAHHSSVDLVYLGDGLCLFNGGGITQMFCYPALGPVISWAQKPVVP